MPEATTLYFQGIRRKENVILQQAAQSTKSGLGSLCALMRMEETASRRKAQKGAGVGGAARPLPTSCHDCSTTESGVEEVHVAFVLV